jgi:hypothetical protein
MSGLVHGGSAFKSHILRDFHGEEEEGKLGYIILMIVGFMQGSGR